MTIPRDINKNHLLLYCCMVTKNSTCWMVVAFCKRFSVNSGKSLDKVCSPTETETHIAAKWMCLMLKKEKPLNVKFYDTGFSYVSQYKKIYKWIQIMTDIFKLDLKTIINFYVDDVSSSLHHHPEWPLIFGDCRGYMTLFCWTKAVDDVF